MIGILNPNPGTRPTSLGAIDKHVKAFEAAWARSGPLAIESFLPPLDDPDYSAVARELVRVDMEFRWECGQARSVDDYRRALPIAFHHPATIAAVAFEEFRQRLDRGDHPDPAEYALKYDLDTAGWEADAAPRTAMLDTAVGLVAASRLYKECCADGADLDTAAVPGAAADALDMLRAVHRTDPAMANRLADASLTLPTAGEGFLGFRLEAELGRGAFGRVFLARQSDLANRLVALKIAPAAPHAGSDDESQTLARLQHTNIVPIYSIHSTRAFRAVCMPYRGGTTLADVVRGLRGSKSLPASGRHIVSTLNDRKLSTVKPTSSAGSGTGTDSSDPDRHRGVEPVLAVGLAESQPSESAEGPTSDLSRTILDRFAGQTYVESILWIGAKLADGLAHAHECNVIHRDLKPANVLLTDDGQPMLLDFNLADNAALRTSEAARIGGTLPYMSPEQLASFRGERSVIDARSDIYSLGLMLFELLTGRPAFPARPGPLRMILPAMVADRSQAPPRLRPLNPAVTPAAEAIVRRCLEPNPDRRYPSARALMEDIERHLADLPLRHTAEPSLRERARKWVRRHPRLASWTTASLVTAVALVALVGWAIVHGREVKRLRAEKQFAGLETARNAQLVLVDSVMNSSVRADTRKAVDMTRAALAPYGVPDNPDWQAGPLVAALPAAEQQRLAVRVGEMLRIWAEAEQRQAEKGDQGPDGLALAARLKAQSAALAGDDSSEDHYFTARDLIRRRQFKKAIPHLLEVTRHDQKHYWAWNNLGSCHYELREFREAIECFGACVGMASDPATTYFAHYHRGMAYRSLGAYPAAASDLKAAIAIIPNVPDDLLHNVRPKAYLLLAEILVDQGNLASNQADYTAAETVLTDALAFGDSSLQLYLRRGEARKLRKDLAGAKRDWEAMLQIEPVSPMDWTFRGLAHLEKGDAKAALADYNQALDLDPDFYLALQNKANVLSVNLEKDDEALVVLTRIVDLYPDYAKGRIGRGVLLARLGKRAAAHADAAGAMACDNTGETLYMAANVYALTSKQEPKDAERVYPLLAAALLRGFGFDDVAGDADMAAVRDQPWFRQVVDVARAIRNEVAKQPVAK